MNQTQEALKMAIEAFELEESTWWSHTKMAKAYQACKEALEQPAQEPVLPFQRWSKEKEMIESWQQSAQEPVAWMSKKRGDVSKAKMYFNEGEEILPLYTHPAPSWQGLSDDDVHNYADHNFAFASEHFEEIFNFYRAIEQALKEKNT